MRFARVPDWLTGIRMHSTERALAVELYRYSSKHDFKAWPSIEALALSLRVSRSAIGRAKSGLIRKGVIAFARDHKASPRRHVLWLAIERPFDFRADVAHETRFAEYRTAVKKPEPRRKHRDGKQSNAASRAALGFQSNAAYMNQVMRRPAPHKRGFQFLTNHEEFRVIGFSSHPEQTIEQTNTPIGASRGTTPRAETGFKPQQQKPTATGKDGGGVPGWSDLSLDDFEQSGSAPKSGMPDKKRPPRKGKPLAENKTPHAQLLAHHCANFERHTGVAYLPNFAKDLHLAKLLLEVYSLDLMKQSNDLFFREKDPFIERVGRSFGMFKTRATVLAARVMKNNKRSGRAQVPKTKIKVGTRKLSRDLKSEKVYDEWDGEKWVQIRVKKKKRPFSPPATETAEGEFDD